MAVQAMKYRFTVDEYQRMGTSGIFHEDDRVELIEGEIVTMTPIGRLHAGCVDYLTSFFVSRVGGRANVRVQNPVRLDNYSEPQPDITLLKHKESFYREGHPKPSDVLLLIEVADSSGAYDRSVKIPLYAKNGIVEFWIVDLEQRLIEAYRELDQNAYQQTATYRPGETLSPQLFPDVVLNVSDVIG